MKKKIKKKARKGKRATETHAMLLYAISQLNQQEQVLKERDEEIRKLKARKGVK